MTAALDFLAQLRLADGRPWSTAAHDFQLEDAHAFLRPDAKPRHYWTRGRGMSKTEDGGGLILCEALASPEPVQAYLAAADQDQAAIALASIAGFAKRSATIGSLVELQSRRVVCGNGSEIIVLAADAASAHGLRGALWLVDEFAQWKPEGNHQRFWEAVDTTMIKNPRAKMIVSTTAGDPRHPAAKVLEAARSAPTMWRVSETPGPSPWADPKAVEELRQRIPQAVFEQLILNRWVAGEGSFLDPAIVDAAFILDAPALERDDHHIYAAALDLGSVSDASVLAIGHREGDVVLLDRLETWQGSRTHPVDFGEVENFIVEAHERFGFDLTLDPWQGLALAQRLRARGIHATEYAFSSASKQRLAATLLHSLNAGNLRLYEAAGLRDELLALRLRQSTSGAWSFDHQRGGHDDRAVAVALMLVGALDSGEESFFAFGDGSASIVGDLGDRLGDPAGSAWAPSMLEREW